jgi:transposase
MESVLRLYSEERKEGVVRLCMDERPCQLLDEVMMPLPPVAGTVKRIDNEYKREGTCVVLLAYDIDRGLRYAQVRAQRTCRDYAEFINEVITTHYTGAHKVKLVQDNLNTHSKGSFYEYLPLQRAGELSGSIDFVFTPKHGSWLNMAEIEFSALSRQCLNSRIATIEQMKQIVQSWTAQRNKEETKIHWSFTVNTAREKMNSRYQAAIHKN